MAPTPDMVADTMVGSLVFELAISVLDFSARVLLLLATDLLLLVPISFGVDFRKPKNAQGLTFLLCLRLLFGQYNLFLEQNALKK